MITNTKVRIASAISGGCSRNGAIPPMPSTAKPICTAAGTKMRISREACADIFVAAIENRSDDLAEGERWRQPDCFEDWDDAADYANGKRRDQCIEGLRGSYP